MDLIQQQDDSTCGVACAAMVAGVPFDVAYAKGKEFVRKNGIGTREMGWLLRRLGVRYTRLMIPELKRCVPHIIVVPSLNYVGRNHYVVIDLSNAVLEVYDPQSGRPGKAFYRRRYGEDEGIGSIDLQTYSEVIRIDGANAEAHGRAVARTVQPLVRHSDSGGAE
jgi:hypothetical protein